MTAPLISIFSHQGEKEIKKNGFPLEFTPYFVTGRE